MTAAVYSEPANEPGKLFPALLTIFVHGLLFVMLFFGVRWQSKLPDMVSVELWNEIPAEVEEPIPEPVKVKSVPKPIQEQAKPEPEQSQPDIAIKKREQEKIKNEQQEKIKKLLNEQLAQETEILKQQERKRKELDRIQQIEIAEKANQMANYIDRIQSKIRSNTLIPANIKGNPEAIFDVIQLPTGEILKATLRKSSGFASYDAAIERAIIKSSPLPQPEDPTLFRRELTLKFRPLD